MAVLQGQPSYTAPSNVHKMMKELELLPLWYADSQDFVLVDNPEKINELDRPKEFGPIASPVSAEFILKKGSTLPPATINPWGVSFHSLHMFSNLKKLSGWPLVIPQWNPAYTQLCGRQTAALCLKRIIEIEPSVGEIAIPVFCNSLEEVYKELKTASFPVICKMPYSSSGRGLLWLDSSELVTSESNWIKGALNKQGTISIEPALNKVQDFAMEFYSNGQGTIEYKGLSLFSTERRGAYSGNILESQQRLKERLSSYLGEELIDAVRDAVKEVLETVYGTQYTGYLGVDMLVYKDKQDKYKIHPCIEVNMRYTMGMLAVHLYERYMASNSAGRFIIDFHKKAGEAQKTHRMLQEKSPLFFEENKLRSGYLPLCPVTENSHYIAYIMASATCS